MSENESLPEPLTPADCDLRHMKWFPLHHKDLADSPWWNAASDVARSRSVDLWVKAYQSVPAASLTNDDVLLAKWAGFNRDPEGWAKHRAEILAPWVLCSDGLLYHPRLAEVAVETWEATQASREFEREKKRRRRERLKNAKSGESPGGQTGSSPRGKAKGPEGEKANVPDNTIEDNTTEKRRESESPPVDSVGAPEAVKPAKAPAAPKAPKATKKAARDARASRIEWDWTPDEIDAAHAAGKGYGPDEIRTMGDGFFNHHKAKGTLMVDWRAAWRTWVTNDGKFNGGPRGGNRTSASNRRPSDDRGVAQRQDRVGAMLAGAMEALDDVRR